MLSGKPHHEGVRLPSFHQPRDRGPVGFCVLCAHAGDWTRRCGKRLTDRYANMLLAVVKAEKRHRCVGHEWPAWPESLSGSIPSSFAARSQRSS